MRNQNLEKLMRFLIREKELSQQKFQQHLGCMGTKKTTSSHKDSKKTNGTPHYEINNGIERNRLHFVDSALKFNQLKWQQKIRNQSGN